MGCALIKAFGTGSQWINASQIAFHIIIFSPSHTPGIRTKAINVMTPLCCYDNSDVKKTGGDRFSTVYFAISFDFYIASLAFYSKNTS